MDVQIKQHPKERDIEIYIDEDKKCEKKLAKKIKKLEKDLYDTLRQRDEALLHRATLERDNAELNDKANHLERLLDAAEKKVHDLEICNEKSKSYIS